MAFFKLPCIPLSSEHTASFWLSVFLAGLPAKIIYRGFPLFIHVFALGNCQLSAMLVRKESEYEAKMDIYRKKKTEKIKRRVMDFKILANNQDIK